MARPLALLALLLALLLAACPGPGGGAGGTTPEPPSGPPPTEEELVAILDAHSPTGAWIAHAYRDLPTEFKIGGRTVTLSSNASLSAYVTEPGAANLVEQLDTAVHEVDHALTSRLGYHLLAAVPGADAGADVLGLYVDNEPVLVYQTPAFPARELDATFPAAARTHRYAVYVSPSDPSYGTQKEGVYSLLDELNAYYHGARTTLDLWGWVERHPTRATVTNFLVDLEKGREAYVEVRLYILHYLLVARERHPEVYRAVTGNVSFRRGYAAVVAGWRALLDEKQRRAPEIYAAARALGVDATIEGDDLHVGDTWHQISTPELRAAAALLESSPYRELEELLLR